MNKKKENIYNLTELWRQASRRFPDQFIMEGFETAMIPNTEWPNRIWTEKDSISSPEIENLKRSLGAKVSDQTLSHFCSIDSSYMPNDSIQLKSTQYGMSLFLENRFAVEMDLIFRKVTSAEEADVWNQSFLAAFNYQIHPETILSSIDKIDFYLVNYRQELVGTVILFPTDRVVGIHGLGILPAKRKQGFATEIMRNVLNQSLDSSMQLATLQASDMAKSMYQSLGFSLDFLMNNYSIK